MRLTLAALLCLAGGWAIDHLYLAGAGARAEAARLREQKDAATAWGLAWKRAKEAGDAAETKLAAQEASRKKTLEEKNREIARLTTGRACLDGAAVRLLDAGPGIRPGGVPETAARPAGAAAAFATDTDVGRWIAVARDAYARCIGERAALIHWFSPPPLAGEAPLSPGLSPGGREGGNVFPLPPGEGAHD